MTKKRSPTTQSTQTLTVRIGADGYYLGLIPESEVIGEAMSVRRRQYGIGAEVFPFFDELVNIPKKEIVAEGMPMIEARNRAIR